MMVPLTMSIPRDSLSAGTPAVDGMLDGKRAPTSAGRRDRADQLGDDVAGRPCALDLAGDPETERHGRVEMPTGYGAERRHHDRERDAVCERDRHERRGTRFAEQHVAPRRCP